MHKKLTGTRAMPRGKGEKVGRPPGALFIYRSRKRSRAAEFLFKRGTIASEGPIEGSTIAARIQGHSEP
jgi:hypothetical protein